MYSVKDKLAVVTGAGSGIGRALAVALAARGARLALADINPGALAETAAMLPQPAFTQVLDVADREAVYAFAEAVRAQCGDVHVVINNAGVAVSQTINEVSYEDFEWLMGINFWGVVHGTKAFLPGLLAQDEGVVVNVSSVFGLIAVPTQGTYNAAKFAVRGFTECLRHELAGTRVRAISVHPGGIRTNIARSARFHTDPRGNRDQAKSVRNFDKLARTSPEAAAETIVRGIEQGRARVLIGMDAQIIDRVQRWLPVRYWSLLKKLM